MITPALAIILTVLVIALFVWALFTGLGLLFGDYFEEAALQALYLVLALLALGALLTGVFTILALVWSGVPA